MVLSFLLCLYFFSCGFGGSGVLYVVVVAIGCGFCAICWRAHFFSTHV